MSPVDRRSLVALPFALAPLRLSAEEDESLIRGPTRPQRLAALGPQSDGVVLEVLVVEGQRVTSGDVLLRLDDQVQAARIGLARASAEAEGELRQAQVQFEEAQVVLGRTQQAAGRGVATDWELRQARARVEMTRAATETAQERRRIERQRLELELAQQAQTVIRAPFDGVVTRVDTVPGATLTRTDRPVTVADLAVIEAVLYVPAQAWTALRLGQSYQLMLSDPVSRAVPARLRHMDPVMDAASGRFRAVFIIDNADGAIPAGLEAGFDLRLVAP
ncbi:efflux RND transporter periplasmic adaptor subunit [Roseomonas terrae]|uniref:Efflux RND transporter periplasmic adaptor subunit n=1 Tax=Neoroseomonas terrae TaxID=424799 RepID=A0ABS5EF23_9PROT|nr:efflux RND transporter periplasmic adaptor subunit [Neoroseomonas terrae]MBR0649614.1 efflux RND transporter periplasmic adaptor subunit [Neoroseomonas terrae]